MNRKLIIVCTVVMLTLLFAGAANAQGGGEVVASGFNGPMGVVVAPDGSIWVIDSGLGGDQDMPFVDPQTGESMTAKFGESAQVVQVAPDGSQTVAASLPSVATGMDNIGGARLALLNGTVYATVGQWTGDPTSSPTIPDTPGVVKIEGGQVSGVASTWPLESSQNPDGTLVDTHPYGLAAGPDGMLWVADAGANDLVKIDPASGDVTLVTAFGGLPGPLPNPARNGAMEADPVPTGVAFDDAGNAYVSFLSGFPFVPGSAKVVKVSSDGTVSDYATGLTTLTQIVRGPDGNFYAVSFGQFSEQGPAPNSGAIIRVKEGDASEVVVDGLAFPTSIDFNGDGDTFVTTNGVGAPGSGEVVKFAGLTGMAGSPIPAEMAPAMEAPAAGEAPATLPQSGGERTGWPAAALALVGGLLVTGGVLLKRRQA